MLDKESGRPLGGANVSLRLSGEIVRGVAAGPDGSFVIPNVDEGTYRLYASFVGYESYRDTLRVGAGESTEVEIRLRPRAEALEEVVVEAAGRSGAAQVSAGRQSISGADLRRIPSPGLSGDLASYMSSQPAVVALGDRGGGLYIQGGEPSQNRVYLDRIPVYEPFHLLGFYSAFPASIVEQTDLYAGSYPARFNGGLSSVVNVRSATGNLNRYSGRATVSPFIGSIHMEGPLVPNRLSALLSYRSSLLEAGASRYVDQPLDFAFSDGFGKLYLRPSPTQRLIGSGFWSQDAGALGTGSGGSLGRRIRWSNRGASLRYLFLPSALDTRTEAYLAFGRLESSLGPKQHPIRRSDLRTIRLGFQATYTGEHVETRIGWQGHFVRVRGELGGAYQNVVSSARPQLPQASLFVTPTFTFEVGGELRIGPGLRGQLYRSAGPRLEPRLRISYERAGHEWAIAAGRYQQELIGLTDRRDLASIYTAWTAIPRARNVTQDVRAGRLGEAIHGVISYRVQPSPHFEVAAQGFYRRLDDLFVQEWTALPELTPRLIPATGRSLGGNVRIEVQTGPLYGFINYGYSNTVYDAKAPKFKVWYGEEGMRFRPPHDRRHQINALVQLEEWGFTLSGRWSFGSGRPYSQAAGFDGFVFIDEFDYPFDVDGERRVIYGEPFGATLPPYHRLDLSLSRGVDLPGRADLTVQASLINAYDRPNIFFLDLFTLERRDQLPLVPTLSLSLQITE